MVQSLCKQNTSVTALPHLYTELPVLSACNLQTSNAAFGIVPQMLAELPMLSAYLLQRDYACTQALCCICLRLYTTMQQQTAQKEPWCWLESIDSRVYACWCQIEGEVNARIRQS